MSISGKNMVNMDHEERLDQEPEPLKNPYIQYFTYISKTNASAPDRGIVTAAEASETLAKLYAQGYRVMTASYTGESSEGAFGVYYFLKLKDA